MSLPSFVEDSGYALAFLKETRDLLKARVTDDALIEKGRQLAICGIAVAIENLKNVREYAELLVETGATQVPTPAGG